MNASRCACTYACTHACAAQAHQSPANRILYTEHVCRNVYAAQADQSHRLQQRGGGGGHRLRERGGQGLCLRLPLCMCLCTAISIHVYIHACIDTCIGSVCELQDDHRRPLLLPGKMRGDREGGAADRDPVAPDLSGRGGVVPNHLAPGPDPA